ncbi:MAG: hypothetical protein ACRDZ4_03380 [Egibacteraceae bacterium]
MADVVAVQLPMLTAPPDLVTCAVGTNDLLRTRMPRLMAPLRARIAGLPPGAVIATLPQSLNALIHGTFPSDSSTPTNSATATGRVRSLTC